MGHRSVGVRWGIPGAYFLTNFLLGVRATKSFRLFFAKSALLLVLFSTSVAQAGIQIIYGPESYARSNGAPNRSVAIFAAPDSITFTTLTLYYEGKPGNTAIDEVKDLTAEDSTLPIISITRRNTLFGGSC